MNTGAFAERVVVDRSQIVPLPEGIAPEAAALLACGVITGVGAVVNSARVRPGQDVVVIGAGGVGLNAIQGARIAGARRIVAVDMTEAKLADARAFGATDGVLATAAAPWRGAGDPRPRRRRRLRHRRRDPRFRGRAALSCHRRPRRPRGAAGLGRHGGLRAGHGRLGRPGDRSAPRWATP
jgi:hypothetical protein